MKHHYYMNYNDSYSTHSLPFVIHSLSSLRNLWFSDLTVNGCITFLWEKCQLGY